MDSALDDASPGNEVMRCIQIGLLCVQDHAVDRPSMPDVVSMLSNNTVELQAPKQPAFFIEIVEPEGGRDENEKKNFSVNGVSISIMEPR